MDDWTAGDYTGLIGGLLLIGGAIGKGLAYLLNWQGAREDRRASRLTTWEASLVSREKQYREEIEHKLAAIESKQAKTDNEVALLRSQNGVLAVSLVDVTDELHRIAPHSPALTRTSAALRAAFPVEDGLPAGMLALLARLDLKDGDR